MTCAEIGEIVGVHADTVGRWLKLSKNQIKVNRGGRKPGQSRHLSAQQENMIQQMPVCTVGEYLKRKNQEREGRDILGK